MACLNVAEKSKTSQGVSYKQRAWGNNPFMHGVKHFNPAKAGFTYDSHAQTRYENGVAASNVMSQSAEYSNVNGATWSCDMINPGYMAIYDLSMLPMYGQYGSFVEPATKGYFKYVGCYEQSESNPDFTFKTQEHVLKPGDNCDFCGSAAMDNIIGGSSPLTVDDGQSSSTPTGKS